MRKTLSAAALLLALCGPVSAGIILCPSATAPPPDGVQAEQATRVEGETEAAGGLTESILSVLESVLSLL